MIPLHLRTLSALALLGLPVAVHADASWTVDLVVVEAGITRAVLAFGLHPAATDGIDNGWGGTTDLGEVMWPPLPPLPNYDARFTANGGLHTDLRSGLSPQAVHTLGLAFQRPGGVDLTLFWNQAAVAAATTSAAIVDPFGGQFVDVDMRATGTATVPWPLDAVTLVFQSREGVDVPERPAPPVPVLQIWPTRIEVDGGVHETEVVLHNRGGGRLTWSVTVDTTWIDVVSAQGSIEGGAGSYTGVGDDTLVVRTRGGGLDPTDHWTEVHIRSNGGNESVFVRMTVAESFAPPDSLPPIPAPPVLAVSPEQIAVDGSGHETDIALRNDGGGELKWSVAVDAVWLDVLSVHGGTQSDGRSLSGVDSTTLIVRTRGAGLPPGTYVSSVSIRSNGGDRDLPVRMTIAGGAVPSPPVPTPIPDPSGFEILSIRDVPNDAGGQVRIVWRRHPNDGVGAYPRVTAYSVFQGFDPRLPSVLAKPASSSYGAYPPGEWTFLAQVPARGVETYSSVAAALADSTPEAGIYHTRFFVSAQTEDLGTLFDTPADSGYSVDNTRPATPRSFTGAVFDGMATLVWEPAGPHLAHFEIYRGATPDFLPGAVRRSAASPRFAEEFDPQQPYYRVAAITLAGRSSPISAAIRVIEPHVPGAFPGDFDGNGRMDFDDFYPFADAFGSRDPRYDVDANGLVDLGDLLLVLPNFGRQE